MSLTETLAALLLGHRVDRLARRQQRIDLEVDRQVEVRHRLLGLEHAPRDDLADRGVRHARVARRHEHRLRAGRRRRARRRSGCWSSSGCARLGGFDVGFDDAAVRSAALDAREIEALVRGNALGERRREDASAARCRCGLRRGSGGRRGLGRSRSRCSGRRCSGCRLCGRRSGGRRRRVLGNFRLALLQQDGDDGIHLHALGAFGHDEPADLALVDRLDLHGRLVGLDLADHLAGFDGVAFFDMPLGELALRHGGRQRGHQDVDRHGLGPASAIADFAGSLDDVLGLRQGQLLEVGGVG